MKNAFVLLVMKGNRYVNGAIVVAYQMKKFKTKADIVCMITSDVDAKELNKYFDKIVKVPYIALDIKRKIVEKNKRENFLIDRYSNWINVSFTKWNCLSLTEYDKVCFIDADTLPIANMDSVFDLDCPAGIISRRRGNISDNYNTHGMKLSSSFINYLFEEELPIFSATFMLLKPKDYEKYISDKMVSDEYPKVVTKKSNLKQYKISNGEDEISIVTFLISESWTIISPIYNYIGYGTPYKNINQSDILCYNYIGNIKPWENKLDKDEWKYTDLALYLDVLKEIKKKTGLDLINDPPEEMIKKEIEVRKYKAENFV